VGSEKPDFNVYLKPIILGLNRIQQGIRWLDRFGCSRVTRIAVSHSCCDSIARSLVQGLSQFNATYGCSYCLIHSPGHYFPPGGSSEYRTHAYHLDLLELEPTEQKYGIKLRSAFLDLEHFDIIEGEL
jgi:hypothetical protein